MSNESLFHFFRRLWFFWGSVWHWGVRFVAGISFRLLCQEKIICSTPFWGIIPRTWNEYILAHIAVVNLSLNFIVDSCPSEKGGYLGPIQTFVFHTRLTIQKRVPIGQHWDTRKVAQSIETSLLCSLICHVRPKAKNREDKVNGLCIRESTERLT